MSDETTLPATSSDWNATEQALYAQCRVRVIGTPDPMHKGRVLVDFLSGDLEGERRWLLEVDLVRKDGEA